MSCGMKMVKRIGNIEIMSSRINRLVSVSHSQYLINRELSSCAASEMPSLRRRMLSSSTTNKMENNLNSCQQQSLSLQNEAAYVNVAKKYQRTQSGYIRAQERFPFHFCINNHPIQLQLTRYLSQSSTTSSPTTPIQEIKQVPLSEMLIWKEVKNPQGKIYYVNARTHERTWITPVGDNVKIFGYKDQVDLTQATEKVKDVAGAEVTKDLRWRISEKIYNELVRSQTLYWVAFAGASGYIGYIYFSSR